MHVPVCVLQAVNHHVTLIVQIHVDLIVRKTVLTHVVNFAVDVVTYAIHVLVCVSVYVQLNVRMDVPAVQTIVVGGVMVHAIKNVLLRVMYIAFLHVLDHVQHIWNLKHLELLDLKEDQYHPDTFILIQRIDGKNENHSVLFERLLNTHL